MSPSEVNNVVGSERFTAQAGHLEEVTDTPGRQDCCVSVYRPMLKTMVFTAVICCMHSSCCVGDCDFDSVGCFAVQRRLKKGVWYFDPKGKATCELPVNTCYCFSIVFRLHGSCDVPDFIARSSVRARPAQRLNKRSFPTSSWSSARLEMFTLSCSKCLERDA